MINLSDKSLIGICGAGAMGAGIAQIAAQSGHRTFVYDRSESALKTSENALKQTLDKLTARKKISRSDAEGILDRLSWVSGIEDLRDCDLVIEAVVERADVKQDLFAALEALVSEQSVLATNTSSLSVSALGASLQHPNRFIGLHFFNPAPIMKLVEIVPGRVSDPALVGMLTGLMRTWKKVPVTTKDVPGFIVNRVARPFYGEGWRALEEEVCSAASIDHLIKHVGGFRMGPLELGDLIGHDINHAAARSIFDAYHGRTRFRPSLLQGQLVSTGYLGRKSGQGIRLGEKPADATKESATWDESIENPLLSRSTSPVVDLIERKSGSAEWSDDLPAGSVRLGETTIVSSNGYSARRMSDQLGTPVVVIDWFDPKSEDPCVAFGGSDETAIDTGQLLCDVIGCKSVQISDRPGCLVLRTWLQLANCAADALMDNVASKSDIDTAMTFGVNYPSGPLQWSSDYGVDNAIEALKKIAEETGDMIYLPSEGFAKLKDLMRHGQH